MAEKPQGNKENARLIEFLIEDLKETGAHLRDTDRKLSLLIQIYAGAFVLIATLSANGIINIEDFVGPPGLILTIVLSFFTWWLFIYSLKSKEHKAIYIRRMNFLRKEMHYFLQNKHKDLLGYWTDLEIKEDSDEILPRKLYRVGLDDLYPVGLQWIIVLFSLVSVIVLPKVLDQDLNLKLPDIPFILLVFICLLVATLILIYTNQQMKETQKTIKRKLEGYKHSSEEKDQEEHEFLIKEKDQKDIRISSQPNGLRGRKKQAPNHD